MQATVVMFPGLNAETEMVRTIRDVCGVPTKLAWYTDSDLPSGTDFVAIPGGFSYGDYLRCGALAKVSPILGAIRAHADRGGFVLGVCNGFQILTEVGLLPGALTRNAHMRFECRDVHVVVSSEGPFTPKKNAVWRLPIAHAEGRYQATKDVLAQLEKEGRIALRYCRPDGARDESANMQATPKGERLDMPTASVGMNPNGSQDDIAGIYGGPKKNVLGLMPHPERMSEDVLGGHDGRYVFESVLARA